MTDNIINECPICGGELYTLDLVTEQVNYDRDSPPEYRILYGTWECPICGEIWSNAPNFSLI